MFVPSIDRRRRRVEGWTLRDSLQTRRFLGQIRLVWMMDENVVQISIFMIFVSIYVRCIQLCTK